MRDPLPPSALRRPCEAASLGADLRPGEGTDLPGQAQAREAIGFALGIRHPGYNLFVLAAPGIDCWEPVRRLVDDRAQAGPPAPDWCYVGNFKEPRRPRALSLPAGRGRRFQQDMQRFCRDLIPAINAAFEGTEVRLHVETLREAQKAREEQGLRELGEAAGKDGLTLARSPQGLSFVPTGGGMRAAPAEAYQERLGGLLHQFSLWRREMWTRMKQVGQEATGRAVGHLIDDIGRGYPDLPDILAFLEEVRNDVIDQGNELLDAGRWDGKEDGKGGGRGGWTAAVQRYRVHLLVDNGGRPGAPVVVEDNPSYQNLLGGCDQVWQLGAPATDLSLLRAGALHRASGGYLLLEADKVLSHPYAWEGLKRAIRAGGIRIETPGQAYGWAGTLPMEPEPVPFAAKVILFGEPMVYYLLKDRDPEFSELFKVAADLEEDVPRDADNLRAFAGFLTDYAGRHGLRPVEAGAAARLLEHASRLSGEAGRLSAATRRLADVLEEADYRADLAGRARIGKAEVEGALEGQRRRREGPYRRVQRDILEKTVLVATEDTQVAQVNGLAAIDLPDCLFAYPVRITATARLGEGEVIDIERESELGGAIHSKGVLILSAFLATRYAHLTPLSLSASLVFEQSYDPVEGDSASLAELCALLSALAGAPIRQSLAVTGAVDQHGQVLAIGAVNEKIEGFFDICRVRGLTGEQGVVIPSANAGGLMLREEVVAAAEAGRFHVYAVDTVDEAIELLTGIPVGQPDDKGAVPPGSVNYRVARQLMEMAELMKQAYGGSASPPHGKRRK